jgi:coenzyme F420-reducing hydrogenase delta subunit
VLPANATWVRFKCPNAFEPVRVLELLLAGAEGVLIAGCAEGEGRSPGSGYDLRERLKVTRYLLGQAGFAPDRVAAACLSPYGGLEAAQAVASLSACLSPI